VVLLALQSEVQEIQSHPSIEHTRHADDCIIGKIRKLRGKIPDDPTSRDPLDVHSINRPTALAGPIMML
jgi:hypothetical protein